MARYEQLREQYMEIHRSFLQAAREKDYNELEGDLLLGDMVTNIYVGVAEPVFVQLVEVLGELAQLSRKGADEAEQQVQRSFQFANTWVLLGMGLSTLLAIVLGWRITRSVTVPAKQAVSVARGIADGDLTQPIPLAGKDEMGVLLQELGQMRDNLEQVVAQVRSNADGVLPPASKSPAVTMTCRPARKSRPVPYSRRQHPWSRWHRRHATTQKTRCRPISWQSMPPRWRSAVARWCSRWCRPCTALMPAVRRLPTSSV